MNKYMNWVVTAGLIVAGAVSLQAKVMEGSVATVNGRPILASEYNAYLDGVIQQYQLAAPQVLARPHAKDVLGREVLKELISKELLYQAAEEAKITVKDSELDEGVNQIKTRFRIDEKTGQDDPKNADKRFNEALKEQGLTLKRYKEKLKKDIAANKLMEEQLKQTVKPVEEADAKALFDRVETVRKNNTKKIKALEKENPAQLKEAQAIAAQFTRLSAERVRVGHIYLAVTKDMSAQDVKKKEELANQIKKELDNGLEFAAAVQKYTEDKDSLASGGDMILIKGVAPKEIDAKAFTLAVGKVSAPIKTDIGYHIIKIKEKRAEQPITFDLVKNDLGEYLAKQRIQQAMGEYIGQLYDKADVKILKKFEDEAPAASATAK